MLMLMNTNELLELITATVSRSTGLPAEVIKSRSNERDIAWARMVCMWAVLQFQVDIVGRPFHRVTLRSVGDYFQRTSGAVCHASTAVQNIIDTESRVKAAVEKLMEEIRVEIEKRKEQPENVIPFAREGT